MKNCCRIFIIIIVILFISNIYFIFKYFNSNKNQESYKIVQGPNDRPSKVLLKIYELRLTGEYEKIRDYIYNVKITGSDGEFDTEDRIINGIKYRNVTFNHFEYSDEGLNYHAKYVDNDIVKGDVKFINNFLNIEQLKDNNNELMEIVNNNPEKILVYTKGATKLGFIQINDSECKLLYSYGLKSMYK